MTLAFCNGNVRGHDSPVDVLVDGDRVAAVGLGVGLGADRVVDVSGHLILPGFVDPHIHLDKCLLGSVMRPNVSGTLQEAIEITNDFKANYDPAEIADRAEQTIRHAVQNGTTSMRVFVDVGTVGQLAPFEGLQIARERVRGLIDLQIVAFPQEGIIRDPGAEELLVAALTAGAEVVGGLPWYEHTDDDVKAHIDICFELAKRFDRPIHMLVDDTDNPNSRSLEFLAAKTIRSGWSGGVSASHCGALAAYDATHAAKVIAMTSAAGITVVSNAHISLMSSGRRDQQPVRRGVTRVRELIEAGVNVASGQDDVFDPYYPFGQPDQLEVAFMMAHAAHLAQPWEIELALDMVTDNAARALGLAGKGVVAGAAADLVVVQGSSVTDVLRMRAPRRFVVKRGHIVAETQTQRRLYQGIGS